MTHDHIHQPFKKGYNQTECNLTKMELHCNTVSTWLSGWKERHDSNSSWPSCNQSNSVL